MLLLFVISPTRRIETRVSVSSTFSSGIRLADFPRFSHRQNVHLLPVISRFEKRRLLSTISTVFPRLVQFSRLYTAGANAKRKAYNVGNLNAGGARTACFK